METPALKMTMMQLTPALPDPYEFSEEIAESLRFIDENPDSGPREITEEMLGLWSAPEEDTLKIIARLEKWEEPIPGPSAVSSLIVFAHLYARHYRSEDFADFENFIRTFGKFQTLLNSIKNKRKTMSPLPGIITRLFDLDNIDDNIYAVNQHGI